MAYGLDLYNRQAPMRSRSLFDDPESQRLHDAYEKARQHALRTGDWSEARRLQLESQSYGKFNRELGRFDKEQGKFSEALRKGFRTSTEFTAARQKRGIEQDVGRHFARRGLGESGFEGQGATTAFGNLASQAQGAQNQFENALNMSLQQERAGFIQGQFDFFHRIEAMQFGNELNMQMAEFQANLQRDLQRAGMFDKILGLGGQVLGGLIGGSIGGPPGAAAGAQVGGAVTTPMQNQAEYYSRY